MFIVIDSNLFKNVLLQDLPVTSTLISGVPQGMCCTSIYICNHSRIIWTSLSLFFCCFSSSLRFGVALFTRLVFPLLLRFWPGQLCHSQALDLGTALLKSRTCCCCLALGRVFVVCTKLQIWLYMLLLPFPFPATSSSIKTPVSNLLAFFWPRCYPRLVFFGLCCAEESWLGENWRHVQIISYGYGLILPFRLHTSLIFSLLKISF